MLFGAWSVNRTREIVLAQPVIDRLNYKAI
jgi:hypothetical protein